MKKADKTPYQKRMAVVNILSLISKKIAKRELRNTWDIFIFVSNEIKKRRCGWVETRINYNTLVGPRYYINIGSDTVSFCYHVRYEDYILDLFGIRIVGDALAKMPQNISQKIEAQIRHLTRNVDGLFLTMYYGNNGEKIYGQQIFDSVLGGYTAETPS